MDFPVCVGSEDEAKEMLCLYLATSEEHLNCIPANIANRYLAQGAAQATEDAAALASALRSCTTIPTALETYERVRKPRATYIARNTRVLQEWLHLYDGDARAERDRMMREDKESNPIFWGWTRRKDWLFGFDASRLDEARKMEIPSLPPTPPDEARVYLNHEKTRRRREEDAG